MGERRLLSSSVCVDVCTFNDLLGHHGNLRNEIYACLVDSETGICSTGGAIYRLKQPDNVGEPPLTWLSLSVKTYA